MKKEKQIVFNEDISEKHNKFAWIGVIFSALIIVIVIKGFFLLSGITSLTISGESMANTLHNGDFIFLKKEDVKRENIIVFDVDKSWDKDVEKNKKDKKYIKRVVAKEGDKVKIRPNKIIVNGKVARKLESYPLVIDKGDFIVPKNKVFVMGDNYKASNDSLYEYSLGNKYFLVDKSQIFATGNIKFELSSLGS